MGKRFIAFCQRYTEHFQLKTRRVRSQAQHYFSGLMQVGRKKMVRNAEVVLESDEQELPHFLSNSAWDERTVLDQIEHLNVEVLHRNVWLWDDKEVQARYWPLAIRREMTECKENKYSLSNVPITTTVHHQVQIQGQRYWIERSLRDGKTMSA